MYTDMVNKSKIISGGAINLKDTTLTGKYFPMSK